MYIQLKKYIQQCTLYIVKYIIQSRGRSEFTSIGIFSCIIINNKSTLGFLDFECIYLKNIF